MGTKSAAGFLTSADSMFTTQEKRDNAQRSYVTDLPTTKISDFPDYPFKVRMDESMTELADSVKERGVLPPVLVRPMPDSGYQTIAGHRRKMAAELVGLPTVPCIVRELTMMKPSLVSCPAIAASRGSMSSWAGTCATAWAQVPGQAAEQAVPQAGPSAPAQVEATHGWWVQRLRPAGPKPSQRDSHRLLSNRFR